VASGSEPLSPELVLVCPALRAEALRELSVRTMPWEGLPTAPAAPARPAHAEISALRAGVLYVGGLAWQLGLAALTAALATVVLTAVAGLVAH